ncbi:MAG TPA: DUF6079 family protein [Actinomycetota bacterium]|nr:DUF6079 family protein [Actinomycetota bacterium]
MKYRELVRFDPIQEVKVLTEADDLDHARRDVRTFVFSDRLLAVLRDVVVPQLRFDQPGDQKGLLIVANYGTGKTHLMSVLSSVAEHAELADELRRPEAKDELEPVAGRFHVVRAEIGATQMSLRDIVCRELEQGLKRLGVTYSFPPVTEVVTNKDYLEEMMAVFGEAYPDRGLLFVLDELLDYLRGRKDAELNLDLRFLREVGEICRGTRFRFVAGIQEALFDNPRFAHVASDVRRVKDRFEQVRISREDIAYVVQERLLAKTTEQRDRIREHLQAFTPLYEGMAERLEEFVALFPVHPAYLRTFERITPVEKREVLKTLSQEMERLLDRDVPQEEPGLIAYDSYRARLAEDPSVRQIPEVREVLEKTDVLRHRIERAMATPYYVPVALRIVDGLAVHRLTTDDIYAPIGPTPKELRDDLCLLPPNLPERDAFFLETTVQTVLDEIVRAVSGQFISENPENGQVYLDLKKDIDYDQRIEERAGSLDDERLDAAYFKALEEVLERRTEPYVSGYRIWEYELPWTEHRVTRLGYLFMGAPNERSTAQPPRDFYVYFLQPYAPPRFTDEEKPDEVFFRLETPDEAFTSALRRYAGATALAAESTETHRGVYEEKARAALQEMVAWLRAHMGDAVSVTYRGKREPLKAWLGAAQGPRATVKEQVDAIAAQALAPHFEARYPGYLRFGAEITRANLEETARQALTHVATGRRTDMSSRVLQSLGLLDVQGDFVETGEYATALLERLRGSGGKAVTRADLLVERDRGVESWPPWHLEPVWLVVVAAVLTQLGRAEIGFPDGQVDALGLDRLCRMSLEELESFTHIAPPKELPVIQLREVAKLLRLAPGIVSDQGVKDEGVQQILTATNDLLQRVVRARSAIQDEPRVWGALLFERTEERLARLDAAQKLLENLRARNSVGKMNKLDVGMEAIEAARAGIDELARVEAVLAARTHLASDVEYLRAAAEIFGPEHPLSRDAASYREDVLASLRSDAAPEPKVVADLRARGAELRRRFAAEAARAHGRDRLDGPGDERKRRILEGELWADLTKLAGVGLLPQGAFGSIQNQLVQLQTCKTFDERKLMDTVICPECGYRPRASAGPSAKALLEGLEGQLMKLREEWVRTLLDTLREPDIAEQIALLPPPDREAVQAFAGSGELPQPVTDDFVRALNQVFERFEVRRVKPAELWGALFPERVPATPQELRERLEGFLRGLATGVSEEKIRIVPTDAEEER